MTQHDAMRRLVEQLGHNEELVVRAYAAMEDRGEVRRRSNKRNLTSLQYARALWNDGINKPWLRR